MTKKKKKGLGFFRILVILLLIVLIVLVLVLILKNGMNLDNKKEDEKTNEVVDHSSEKDINEVVKISCNKYDVYFDDDNKLGFNFIIAELDFANSNGSLYYDLGYLTTSEKIKLNDVEFYLNKIKSYHYDINNFDLLDTQFSSEGGNLRGNVFIPFLENYNEICIYNGEVIKFDLTKNKHSITELFYDVQTEDIKTDEYDISISTSYIENQFITSDTGDEFACHYALAFELVVNKLSSKNIRIVEAKFVPENAMSGGSFDALDDHVDSLRIKNIINKNLKEGDVYGLFFQIDEQITQKGSIMIKFSNSDNWVEVKEG